MRAVRCDACGAKAMIAAAQCPKCSHLFQLRDGFGDLLPLAYCSSCESYYPESVGSCRWCGTKPEHAPRAPLIWRGAGVVAFVGIVATAWILRDRAARSESSAPVKTVASSTPAAVAPTVVPQAAPLPAAPSPATTDSVARPVVDSSVVRANGETVIPNPPSVATPAASPPAAPPPTRQPARWVTSVARQWVVIRTDATKQSRIVASIGPNSRVQLGEVRGSWRRIRAQGLAGWVEASDSFGTR